MRTLLAPASLDGDEKADSRYFHDPLFSNQNFHCSRYVSINFSSTGCSSRIVLLAFLARKVSQGGWFHSDRAARPCKKSTSLTAGVSVMVLSVIGIALTMLTHSANETTLTAKCRCMAGRRAFHGVGVGFIKWKTSQLWLAWLVWRVSIISKIAFAARF